MSEQKHILDFGNASSTKNNVFFAETDDMAAITAQVIGGTKNVNRIYARRIVACVNACAGVPSEHIEAYPSLAVGVINERNRLSAELAATKKQNEELFSGVDPEWANTDSLWVVMFIKNNSIFDHERVAAMLEFAKNAAIASAKVGE